MASTAALARRPAWLGKVPAGRHRRAHARRRPPARWALAIHAAVLLVLLLSVASIMDLHTTWVGDEGSYGLAVHALERGAWQYDYVGRSFDRDGRWLAIDGATGGAGFNGRFYAYLKHPVDVVLPWLGGHIFGWRLGYNLPALFGAVLAAVAAWLLATEYNRRAAPLAFWLAALSPVAVNAYLLWAHALSAGVAGLTAWAAVRCWRRGGDWRWGGAAVVGMGAGVTLRSEALFFAVAVALVTAAALAAQGARRSGGLFAAAGVGVAYGTRQAEALIVEAITRHRYVGTPEGVQGIDHSGYLAGRLRGAAHDLLAGSEANQHASHLLAIVLVLAVVAGLALRWGGKRGFVVAAPAVVIAIWLYVVRFAETPLQAATGLFAAAPALMLGLICCRRPRVGSVPFQLAAIVLLFSGAVVASDYLVGGALEWGGRFFSPALPLLAALAAGGLVAALGTISKERDRVVAGVLVAGLAIVPAVSGLHMLRSYRLDKDRFYGELTTRSSDVILVNAEPLRELGRSAWRFDPKVRFMFAPNDYEANAALAALRAAGYEDVTLLKLKFHPQVTGAPYTSVRDVTGPVINYDSYQLWRLTG